jgi:hypothetical protein
VKVRRRELRIAPRKVSGRAADDTPGMQTDGQQRTSEKYDAHSISLLASRSNPLLIPRRARRHRNDDHH